MYTLSLYPTQAFYDSHRTNNPRTATIGAVGIFLLTSVFFFLYDAGVRKEFMIKKDLLEAKRRFMRFISHEVRTPLAALCMGLDVLHYELLQPQPEGGQKEDGTGGNEKAKRRVENQDIDEAKPLSAAKARECLRLVEDVQSNAQCAVDVLNDILDYDKVVERRALSLDVTVIPIWGFLERTMNEFRLSANNKNITLSWKAGEHGAEIVVAGGAGYRTGQTYLDKLAPNMQRMCLVGDAVRLKQVLRNMLSNAIKFTPESGSVRMEVSFECIDGEAPAVWESGEQMVRDQALVKQQGFCHVRVVDTGVGMTSDQIGSLFGEGVQFNANELQHGQGSGLGLFITKGIVELHQGTIEASSDGLGRGTTFEVTVPVYHVDTSEESRHASLVSTATLPISERTDHASAPPPTSLNILIVEDVASNRKLLKRLLERRGHTCAEAENGLIAVDMVRQSLKGEILPFDTILMDYEMPVMDGPTAAKEIVELGGGSDNLFIVGVTGNMLSEDVEFYCSSGATTVLPKPLKISTLEEVWTKYGISHSTEEP